MDHNINSVVPLREVFKKICYFLLSQHKWQVVSLITIIFISGITTSVDSILLQKLTDQIEQYSNNHTQESNLAIILLKWILIYALWWEALNITWLIYNYIYLKTLPKIKAQVINELYDHIQYHSYSFFQGKLAGEVTNRITEGSRSLEMIFTHLNEDILRKFSVIIFALITMYIVHYAIALIFLTWLIIFVSTSLYFAKNIHHYSAIYSNNKALISGKIVDAIANISVIRMFTSHKFEKKYLFTQTEKAAISDQNMLWFMLKLRYGLGISCTIMIAAVVYYIVSLRGQNIITIGQCVLVITLCIAITEDIWDLTKEFGDVFEQIGVFSQAISLIQKYTITDIENAQKLIITHPSIEFQNVTFYYQNQDNIFKNKSVKIEAYQKVGLAGFSGSGKTTFTNLIARLFDIEEGRILIDGQDIKTVTQDSLRRNISIIPQEPILFHRTIIENIKYGAEDATPEEVVAAAKSAYIHDFITKLPEGYNTLCGERGNNLSGGQRQRIIIARAILKNAPILILDEATSALDNLTENLIQRSLKTLMKGKTVLVIAHRLSTLLNMDRILVFDNGHIVEDGTHNELKTNGKLYKQLWNAQKGGSIAELY